jgi:hypothetical protein
LFAAHKGHATNGNAQTQVQYPPIGTGHEFRAEKSGCLYLFVNDGLGFSGGRQGQAKVTVKLLTN